MDYFKILNLNREPFSNSPEPEFFFESTVHLACLQQLELAIRLRRGLNVVMGDVGTGKTTLCRQLILRFSETEDDRAGVETHLLLDPSFSNPREFLTTVAQSFGLSADAAKSEWQLKESIKNYLFQKGVDEKKTVILIIDEGQKLPEFCLEILREFLNYETNENKLLQIVIFAQNEFKQTLKDHENFADRVNQYYFLGPLNFKETKMMIHFRLARAGRGSESPFLFTFPGMWGVYRATGGLSAQDRHPVSSDPPEPDHPEPRQGQLDDGPFHHREADAGNGPEGAVGDGGSFGGSTPGGCGLCAVHARRMGHSEGRFFMEAGCQ